MMTMHRTARLDKTTLAVKTASADIHDISELAVLIRDDTESLLEITYNQLI
jgi:hypothetical protein